jgi:hypothetical protein
MVKKTLFFLVQYMKQTLISMSTVFNSISSENKSSVSGSGYDVFLQYQSHSYDLKVI